MKTSSNGHAPIDWSVVIDQASLNRVSRLKPKWDKPEYIGDRGKLTRHRFGKRLAWSNGFLLLAGPPPEGASVIKPWRTRRRKDTAPLFAVESELSRPAIAIGAINAQLTYSHIERVVILLAADADDFAIINSKYYALINAAYPSPWFQIRGHDKTVEVIDSLTHEWVGMVMPIRVDVPYRAALIRQINLHAWTPAVEELACKYEFATA